MTAVVTVHLQIQSTARTKLLQLAPQYPFQFEEAFEKGLFTVVLEAEKDICIDSRDIFYDKALIKAVRKEMGGAKGAMRMDTEITNKSLTGRKPRIFISFDKSILGWNSTGEGLLAAGWEFVVMDPNLELRPWLSK